MVFEVLGRTRVIPRQWHDCPEAQAAQREKETEARRSELESRAIQLVMKAGIHIGKYKKMTFETWDTGRHEKAAKHLQDILDYTNEVKQGTANLCFLWGKYGTGKTHLAVAALRKIIHDHIDDDGQGWKPYLVDWAEHCSMVQQSWDKDDNEVHLSEGQLWGLMKTADILLVDDIDKGRPSEWAMGKLYEVMQHRYMRERATIITANHSIEQLQAIWAHPKKPEFVRDLGGAILSRFNGQLWGEVEITGPDQRDVED
jgi:DNA replication protein DnaC